MNKRIRMSVMLMFAVISESLYSAEQSQMNQEVFTESNTQPWNDAALAELFSASRQVSAQNLGASPRMQSLLDGIRQDIGRINPISTALVLAAIAVAAVKQGNELGRSLTLGEFASLSWLVIAGYTLGFNLGAGGDVSDFVNPFFD